MHLVLFETGDFASLAPFTFFRPTFLLRCGVTTLLEKQLRHWKPTRISLWVRPELETLCRSQALPLIRAITDAPTTINQPLDDEPTLLCDGRVLPTDGFLSPMHAPGLSSADVLNNTARFQSIEMPKLPMVHRPWELLGANEAMLLSDIAQLRSSWRTLDGGDGSFHIIGKNDVLVDGEVTLKPGCVLDASGGPIALGAGVVIGSNAVVQGPCSIGDHSEIAPLALIRPRCTIGPRCKFGGEVSAVIVQGYSNKAHDGFLGDSVIGEWANLGAGTTTSNLKNTYGEVAMHSGGHDTKTSRTFLGSLIGDHTKTAIGTRLMTGSYVGCCSMIATSKHPPRLVKSFRFLSDDRDEPYRVEKAQDVAAAAYARRQKKFTPEDAVLLRAAQHWSAASE